MRCRIRVNKSQRRILLRYILLRFRIQLKKSKRRENPRKKRKRSLCNPTFNLPVYSLENVGIPSSKNSSNSMTSL